MPTPPKPYLVLSNEKKSHRTKSELKLREQGEKALSTGDELREQEEVKNNEIASREFRRINDLLIKIEKNDAIYESVINRYCIIYAECMELETQRKYFLKMIQELKEMFEKTISDLECKERPALMIEFVGEISRLVNNVLSMDKSIQTKRKMLFDIEKENVMTIASALRCIPKKEGEVANPLLRALHGD